MGYQVSGISFQPSSVHKAASANIHEGEYGKTRIMHLKNMYYIFWIPLILMFCACKMNNRNVNIKKTGFYTIIDSGLNPVKTASFDITECDFPIYYMGYPKDSIKIGRRYFERWTIWKDDTTQTVSVNYIDKNLTIKVDTSYYTILSNEYISRCGNIIADSTENFKALLITICNISDSTLYLGSSFSLYHMYIEIKNGSGKWIKATQKLSEQAICMSSRASIFLKPQQIIIAKARLHTGDTIAEFRLAFEKLHKKVFSNTYMDSIDKKVLLTLH